MCVGDDHVSTSPPKCWSLMARRVRSKAIPSFDRCKWSPSIHHARPAGLGLSAWITCLLTPARTLDQCDDHRRLKAFQYFSEKIIPNVQKAGPDGPQVNGSFSAWITHHAKFSRTQQPAIDYLISAISTVHGASWGLPGSSDSVFYFDCISNALERLRKIDPGDEMVIVSCTLLGICEQVRTGDLSANSSYMSIALRVLSEWKTQPEAERSERRKRLIAALLPALQVSQEANHEAQSLNAGPTTYKPPAFLTLQIAENALYDRIIRWVIPRAVTNPAPATDWVVRCPDSTVHVVLDGWHHSVQPLEEKPGPRSIQELTRMSILQAHYQTAKLMLTCLSDAASGALSEDHDPSVHQILCSLEMVDREGLDTPISAIAPAFFIATSVDDEQLRSRALAFLGRINKREDAWNSRVALIIARAVISLQQERRGLAGVSAPRRALQGSASPVEQRSPQSTSSYGSTSPQSSASSSTSISTHPAASRSSGKRMTTPETKLPQSPGGVAACIRAESATFFPPTTRSPEAKLTLRYTTSSPSGPQSCTKLVILSDAEDVRACQRVAHWPIDAIIKSWGYLRSNHLPVPYAASDVVVRDRVLTKSLESASRGERKDG